jgi:ElaB/YqjD/DUF883 family membrane-anchored ribosome-binding protein
MSITTETAQDRTAAARDEAAQAAATLAKRSRALYADTTAQAGRYLERTKGLAKDVSTQAVSLVKSNPIKTAALGAALAAVGGIAIGVLAIRARA